MKEWIKDRRRIKIERKVLTSGKREETGGRIVEDKGIIAALLSACYYSFRFSILMSWKYFRLLRLVILDEVCS